MNRHLERIHDIGTYKCDVCLNNRNSSIKYTDKNNIIMLICRNCFNKLTGYKSRMELIMSKYLDKIKEIRPYLVGTDQSFKSMEGCQRYRPDKIYMSSDLVLHIECDEHQHKYNNGNYSCDERRISECYDEFTGKKYVIIRWNPDNYKPPKKIKKKNIEKRLETLGNLIQKVLNKPPNDIIYIYYLFYDKNNKRLARNIKYDLVY